MAASRRGRFASADRPTGLGYGESLKEPLHRLSARATGPADLDGLQPDATATGLAPSVERGDVGLAAPTSAGEFGGGLSQGKNRLASRVNHKLPPILNA